MTLSERIKQGKPQGTFQAKVTDKRTVARWVELNITPTPTFAHPRVAVKELSHG